MSHCTGTFIEPEHQNEKPLKPLLLLILFSFCVQIMANSCANDQNYNLKKTGNRVIFSLKSKLVFRLYAVLYAEADRTKWLFLQ